MKYLRVNFTTHAHQKCITQFFSFFNIPIFLQELSGRSKTKRRQKISQKSKQPRQSGEPCYHRVSALNEANYLPKSVQNMHLHVEAKERPSKILNLILSLSLSLSLANVVRSSSGSSSLEGEQGNVSERLLMELPKTHQSYELLTLSLSLYTYTYIYKTI